MFESFNVPGLYIAVQVRPSNRPMLEGGVSGWSLICGPLF